MLSLLANRLIQSSDSPFNYQKNKLFDKLIIEEKSNHSSKSTTNSISGLTAGHPTSALIDFSQIDLNGGVIFGVNYTIGRRTENMSIIQIN